MADVEKAEKDLFIIRKKIQSELDKDARRPNPYNGFMPTIFRVAENLRKVNPGAYTPRLVAIGPIHRSNKLFQSTHQRKVSHMQQLLSRTFHLIGIAKEETLKACVQVVHAKISEIRRCYGVELTNYSDPELAEMMVIDGCFILELFYIFYTPVVPIPHVDPVIHNALITFDVKHDLSLLENQIPFFVLQDMFEHTVKKFAETLSLTELVLSFFQEINAFKGRLAISNESNANPDHILGLLQECFRPRVTERIELSEARSYSATELARSGVTFSTHHSKNWKLAVKFEERSWFQWLCSCLKPVLKIPVLRVVDSTEYFLRNLIAYEQCSPAVRHYITSYASLMDTLVDTREDVDLLARHKIIENKLGSSEDAANLINNLCNEIIYQEFFYAEQWQRVENHCNRLLPKTIARMRRRYFSNPWSSISVMAAFVLFALTLVQTYFTVHTS